VGGFLPTLDLDAGAAWYRADDGGGPGWSAGADLAVPIFASGLRAAELDAADAALAEARLTLEGERLRLLAALAAAEVRHSAAQEALQAREEAVTAAQAAQELVQARYQTGVDDLTTLLQARQAWEQAAVARARAEAELGAALAALEAARGVSASR
jgi:outer membrane protein TolC